MSTTLVDQGLTPTIAVSLLVLFLLVSALSWWLVGRVKIWLLGQQQVDVPNERSSHQGRIPRGAGLVISAVLVLGFLAVGAASRQLPLFSGFACLLFCWSLVSWWDDRRSLPPGVRFPLQTLLAVLAVTAIGWVSQVFSWSLGLLGIPFSVFGLLWLANLYNFMDGIDGLAASQTIVGALTFACWLLFLGNVSMAIICLLAAAASYGFLLWNWQPAKVFMGDVGSVTLGAFFGMLMLYMVTRHHVPILSCLLVFGVFIIDATVTLIIRIVKRERFWRPHRQHLYQRLVNAGHSHQRVTLVAIGLMLGCSILATLSLNHHVMMPTLIGLEFAVYAALWTWFYRRQRVKNFE